MAAEATRQAIATAVAACREVLVGDYTGARPGDLGQLLEAPYGFDPRSGLPRPVDQMAHLQPNQVSIATMLRDWHGHLAAAAGGDDHAARAKAAYAEMKYELGFTVLHRLCALCLAEEREYLPESVRQGMASTGFRLYAQLAGTALGVQEEVYALYLDRIYDELARDLPAVFDRRSPASLVRPTAGAILKVVSILGSPDLTDAWADDETLGWIFEDYNDAEERKEMRKSDAPRNARELAVRNQFFTPRWVVEFLTDNTLGRWWAERCTSTELLESCRFLMAPDTANPSRPDPREISVLDPACGSGHFLLYAYDLLETIYLEAWRSHVHRGPDRKPLWEEYGDEAGLRRDIPRLILENNLYGVDIDPRCVQEAALALWLRAQRTWRSLGLKGGDRPQVRRVNIVSAQTLPSDPRMRAELKNRLKPAVLGRLAEALLQRVGEIGLLLRPETAIAETISQVRKEYLEWKRKDQERGGLLFPELAGPKQAELSEFVELRQLDDQGFWNEAEARLKEALSGLQEEAQDDRFRQRLFADDMRHGMEFFDLARRRFDVVVMNPPFGEPSQATSGFLDEAYPASGGDLLTMFYERALELLQPGGRAGAITNRTWLTLVGMEAFRTRVLGSKGEVEIAADLGSFVLNAQVETAAVVLGKDFGADDKATWVRLLKTRRKAEVLREALMAAKEGGHHRTLYRVSAASLRRLPQAVYAYWMSHELREVVLRSALASAVADVRQGTATADDFRFLRLSWEVPPAQIGLARRWARFAKGGEYRPFFDDVHLLLNWERDGRELIAWGRGRPQNTDYFGRGGVTWPNRTTSGFGPRVLPKGMAFGHMGPALFPREGLDAFTALAVLRSSPARLLLSVRVAAGDDAPGSAAKHYEVGMVRDLAWPRLTSSVANRLSTLAREASCIVLVGQQEEDETGETVASFALPPSVVDGLGGVAASLKTSVERRVATREDRLVRVAAIENEIDELVTGAYAFAQSDRDVMAEELELPLAALGASHPIEADMLRSAYLTKEALDGKGLPSGVEAETDVRVEHRRGRQVQHRSDAVLCRLFDATPSTFATRRRELGLIRKEDSERVAADIVSWAMGVAFGRWDVRLIRNPEWVPKVSDPTAPYPACPFGQLVKHDGLPASEDRVASEPWLKARADLHPPQLPEAAQFPELPAREYPVQVAWDGILVDDTLDAGRPDDIHRRIGSVLEYVFGASRVGWETDLAEALDAKTIAHWFRSPTAFFKDHLSRYRKSRRAAPIYWPISTRSGRLTYWVYAPRFSDSTVASLINRLRDATEKLRDLRAQLQRTLELSEAAAARAREYQDLESEIGEREELLSQLEKLVREGYKPHSDDGFVVTAAPLRFAFRLPAWRAMLDEVWTELSRGDLDWAHLAMSMWPGRVREKCKTDLSLAIAHELEHTYAPTPAAAGAGKPRGRGRRRSAEE